MAKGVKASDIEKEIQKVFKVYSDEIAEKSFKITKKTMSKFVKKTKEKAPRSKIKGRKHFADSISSTTETNAVNEVIGTWYVKDPNYRLTHLLEHGHQNRNGTRTPGTHFISKIYEEIAAEYEEELEGVIKND